MRFDKPAATAFLARFYGRLYNPVFGTLYQGPEGGSGQDPRQEAFPQQLLQQIRPHLEIKIAWVPTTPCGCVPVSPAPNIQI